MIKIDLDRLERLAAQATPGPWYPAKNHTAYDGYGDSVFTTEQTHNLDNNLAYITAACNALPGLIAENRALRERVAELKRQRDWLAARFGGEHDGVPASEYFLQLAKEATKEADNA